MNISNRNRLLLADNDPDYRRSLRSLLELENYTVVEAATVEEAIHQLNTGQPDAALVDLRLNNDSDTYDFSGLEVAKETVSKKIPCLIITAFATVEITRIALRSLGTKPLAVDIIPKSSGPQAVLDAIKVGLNSIDDEETKPGSDLVIDLDRKLVWYKGGQVDLSRLQYALLTYLYIEEGRVCSPKEIIKAIYGEDIPTDEAIFDRRLERLVDRLKTKIEENPSEPRHILKVYGRGYRLVVDS